MWVIQLLITLAVMLILVEASQIYITGTKAALKSRPLVKYGLPLLALLLLLPSVL